MSSVQKYFNFNTYIACGIPEVELLGTEQDWRDLIRKLEDVKKVLAPISQPLGNITTYFDDIVLPVYQNLLETFLGRPNRTWWNDIVLRQAKVEQVYWSAPSSPSSLPSCSHSRFAQSWRRWWSAGTVGWLNFLMGRDIKSCEILPRVCWQSH